MIQEIRVVNTRGADPRGRGVLREIQRILQLPRIADVRAVKVYRLEGVTLAATRHFAGQVLSESVDQRFVVGMSMNLGARRVAEAAYKPGVMNPEAANILKVAEALGVPLVAADSSWEYHFFGRPSKCNIDDVVKRLLVNSTVQTLVTTSPRTLIIGSTAGRVTIVPIRHLTGDELVSLSKRRELHLNQEEMLVIQQHFRMLGRDPTDGELETLAQTWSEHCCHKTFNARLMVNGKWKSSLMARLKAVSRRYDRLVATAFADNAGGIKLYEGYVALGKVETHNAPSAIEPFGGSQTGVGGVLRDILGTGQGAIILLSTDMFCFAPLDLPLDDVPYGCLHPDYLFRHVVRGVGSYGNCVGVPTANGSVHFHRDFRAKPSVIVGAYGLIKKRMCRKGVPKVGDAIIAIGGRTGRDGIHGATFSSGAMTDRTITVNSTAVQIGNALEEKRMIEATLACNRRGYIRAITDCGAGGFSSAIGEMGSKLGVRVYLERAPLKYPGLSPWEIWISEAQERMVMAVAPNHVEGVLNICRLLNVEATVLGEFTGTERLVVTYDDQTVCDMDMEFLHHGLPQRVMKACWKKPVLTEPAIPAPRGESDWLERIQIIMAHGNVCSKRPIVETYDHGVQRRVVLSPFTGPHFDGPNDAVVLTPLRDKPYGMIVSHGLNPVLNTIDPYWGTLWALVEALANLVAVGGDYRQCGLIDNFIWPTPTEQSLGALDRSVDALCRGLIAFMLSLFSGKDSMGGTFRSEDGSVVIEIPPVVCISALGRVPDIHKTITADFKQVGSHIVLVGQPNTAMGGSVYYDNFGHLGSRVPRMNLELLPRLFRQVHRRIVSGDIISCHDVSEGGTAATLIEQCIGGDVGATVNLRRIGQRSNERLDYLFFNEKAGMFVCEVPQERMRNNLFRGIPWQVIGHTTSKPIVCGTTDRRVLFEASVTALRDAWQRPIKEVMAA